MAAGNEITVVGNITSDVDLRVTPNGSEVARFSVAWNRRFQQDGEWQEEPHYFDVTCWRDLAVNVAESFVKGSRVVVVGRLEQQRWEDKESGANRSKVAIVADDVAASVRWAIVEITKSSGGGDDRGGRGGRDSGQSRGRGDSGGGRGRESGGGGGGRYEDEVPF